MAVPAYVGGNVQTNAAAQALTMDIVASGATVGDFMIVFMHESENAAVQLWDDDGGGGNGWTLELQNRTTSGRDMECAIYWKFHDGSESNPTFTWNVGGTNEQMTGLLLAYSGVDTVTPFNPITFTASTNDGNPPNPPVSVTAANTRVLCFHAATHDDISGAFPPTGFTMRDFQYGGSAQHTQDHRDTFSADIQRDVIETYQPPDWQHTVANTTPEYQTYSVALNEVQLIHVTGGTAIADFNWGNTGLTILGDGFGTSQGVGKVEYWSDTAGTIKTVQTIVTWNSDTSITIDTVQGSLLNNTQVFLVVTNNAGDVSSVTPVNVGVIPYSSLIINTLKADHYWQLNNVYTDTGSTGPQRDMTSAIVGTWTFNTQEIADDNTHSLNMSSVTNKREIVDSANMNITIDSGERTVASWLQLNSIQHSLGAVWKEGGGVQNLAFLVGYGNVLLAQGADSPGNAINAQSWSDFKLAVGRPYHICLRYSLTETTKELRLYVDGIEMPDSGGNPLGTGAFNAHSGDVVWGDPDNNLETGGTDIAYAGMENAQISDFATWSDNSQGPNKGALDKVTEIRDILFRRGALPDDIIGIATESAQQIALDVTADARPNWPLSYRIEAITGGGSQTLTLNAKVFDPLITMHLEYRGLDTLTLINTGTSNIDPNKIFSTAGGTVTVLNDSTLTITNVPNGAEVRVYDAGTTTELGGAESVVSGTFVLAVNESITTSVDVRVVALGFVIDEFFAVDLSGGDVGIPLSPRIDRVFRNP